MLWKTCLTQTSINHSKLIFLHKKRSNEQTDTLFDVAISLCLYLSRQHGCLPIPACCYSCQYFGSNRSCPVLISSRLGMRTRFDVLAWPVIQCISTYTEQRRHHLGVERPQNPIHQRRPQRQCCSGHCDGVRPRLQPTPAASNTRIKRLCCCRRTMLLQDRSMYT